MKTKKLLSFLLAASCSGALLAQQNLQVRINQASDDMEEYIPGTGQSQTVGNMDSGSSDLELGSESANNVDPQLVGLRFSSVNIPKGAYIKSAYIEFTVDATNKNSDPCNLIIKAEDNDNPLTFDDATPFNLSSRAMLADSVNWSVSGTSWGTVGSHGPEQQTADISTLVQALVNRSAWQQGNAMAFFVKGTGLREVESFDGSASGAALLVIEFAFKITEETRVSAAEDDLEELIPGAGQTQTIGSLDPGSSDLELGAESVNNVDPQMVGIRFASVNVPANAEIVNAYIEFTVDATNKNTDPCNLTIKGQDDINSVSFNGAVPFDISSRPTLSDSVNWSVSGASWNTVGAHGADQQTPNLKELVKSLVGKAGWTAGKPMTFFISGTGLREVESFDGSSSGAPLLVIDYLSDKCVGIPTTTYPISKGDSWSFDETGVAPDANWKKLSFNDTCWTNGSGALGYGTNSINSTLSYGADANNKPATVYLRKRINIADVNSLDAELEVNLRINDGVILYVNETEVLRYNMPSGAVSHTTLATKAQAELEESAYYTFNIAKTAFTTGDNVIAAEVHQAAVNSDELVFDMEIRSKSGEILTEGYGCTSVSDEHISCYTSITPRSQNDTVDIPFNTHAMEFLYRKGDTYTDGGGTVPGNFDFTGYVGINGSSKEGYLSVNHENSPGGVSMLEIHFDDASGLWLLDSAKKVDFGGELVKTVRNCSGGITPWGTIITSEESTTTSDDNNDGYHDIGWQVEIDPATARVVEYGNGKREKLWKMGKMSHENIVVSSDKKTAYYGEDAGSGMMWKFVATTEENLSEGSLYVMKLDLPLSGGEPQSSVGTWVLIDNSTPTLCNNIKASATGFGATQISGIEDAEINPMDGKIYFTAKGTNRIYRFKDDGATISEFETYAGGGVNYLINTGNGKVISEAWGSGNDNLTFDDRGNLYVLQDGSRNHVWMLHAGHTQANPKVEVFMVTPKGSEPTGMTFSPDFKYMFISIQHPSGNLPQKDVAGTTHTYGDDVVLVVSRKEFLGVPQVTSVEKHDKNLGIEAYPNPFKDQLNVKVSASIPGSSVIELFDYNGRIITSTQLTVEEGTSQVHTFSTKGMDSGVYFVKVSSENSSQSLKVVLTK